MVQCKHIRFKNVQTNVNCMDRKIKLFLTIGTMVAFYLCWNYEKEIAFQCYKHFSSKVTRIIHRSWKTRDIPKDFRRYFPSWKRCFPDWKQMFWTDQDNRNLIAKHYPWFLSTYDSFPAEIYRADVSRYFYLYHYGGIYTDMDNECLATFEHLLTNYTFVFGTIDQVNQKTPLPENYVQNSFMYSRPRQQFWLELVKRIYVPYFNCAPDIVTGPVHLCNMIHLYRRSCPSNHNVKIYDAWVFNPVSWGGYIKYKYCKPVGKMTDDEWLNCKKEFVKNGSFVIQYHSHVWG